MGIAVTINYSSQPTNTNIHKYSGKWMDKQENTTRHYILFTKSVFYVTEGILTPWPTPHKFTSPGIVPLVFSVLSAVSLFVWLWRPRRYSWRRRTPARRRTRKQSTWPDRCRWLWRMRYGVGMSAHLCWSSSSSTRWWYLEKQKFNNQSSIINPET